ncbi:sulfatase family protein [Stieleria varia]|uniref:Choline-sulfatase n=1 Tax=Stieleria varia TaxID=2528005 RepID=A0A5C6B298_9BACT|nr:sulfatase [Stieleria varia]TWU05589.1 Choline-sulfatase [Stieleria varia]
MDSVRYRLRNLSSINGVLDFAGNALLREFWRIPLRDASGNVSLIVATGLLLIAMLSAANSFADVQANTERPNILIAISDDQSYPHASAYGDPAIKTPAFDRVAKQGILFRNAFTPAPGCSPMRAAFLTGREIWQNREAGTHASDFPTELPVFTQQLEQAGYHVGMTGKGWGPGKSAGWPHNPAGKGYGKRKMEAPKGISNLDYAANFEDFLAEQKEGQPFCFWFGGQEPHRVYGAGLGAENGVDPAKVNVPKFLPDSDAIRSDMADYLFEVQWFDSHLQRMLDKLAETGQLDNTLVIVTSDNGMPFPRAKANLYEYGIHMPMAVSWPAEIPAGQDTDDLVSLIDVTRVIFEAARVVPRQSEQLSGVSFLSRFHGASDKTVPARDAVFSGRERHSSSRYNTLGYPSRCVRTKTHLYIRNFKPERWPAGPGQKYDGAKFNGDGELVAGKLGPPHAGYHDIDDGPTLRWMVDHRDEPKVGQLLSAAVDLRPAVELYDIRTDPACMDNLAGKPEFAELQQAMAQTLQDHLVRTGDLRQTDPAAAEIWETYPRHSSLRWFETPQWAIDHPDDVPEQPWLEARRPRQESK